MQPGSNDDGDILFRKSALQKTLDERPQEHSIRHGSRDVANDDASSPRAVREAIKRWAPNRLGECHPDRNERVELDRHR